MEPVFVVSQRETVLKNHWKMGNEFGICYWSFLPLWSISRIATIDTSSRPTNYQSADQVKKKKQFLIGTWKIYQWSSINEKQKAAYCRCLLPLSGNSPDSGSSGTRDSNQVSGNWFSKAYILFTTF